MSASNGKILLVEDDECHADLILRAFESSGYSYEISAVTTLTKAKKLIAAESPDLIISDIRLPDGEGIELLTTGSADRAFAVIIMTGFGTEQVAVDSMKAGALDYIVKSPEMFRDLPRIANRAMREWSHIVKHKQTELALAGSEAKYRELVNSMKSGVAVYEAVDDGGDFIFKEFNCGAENIEDIPRETVIGKRVTEVFPMVGKFGLLEVFQKVYKTGKPEHFPQMFYADNRICGWRENYIYKLGSGEVVAIYEDITEKKETELELLRKNAILQGQTEASIDGILIVNEIGRIVNHNGRFAEMWEIPEDLIESRDDERLLNYVLEKLSNPEAFIEKVKRLYANRDECSRDEIGLKDGRYFDRYSSPLVDSTGHYHGRIWFFRDISDLKRAEFGLRQSKRELEITNRIADIFLTIPDDEMFSCVLDLVLDLTESKHGVFGYINQDGNLVCPSMTRDIFGACQMPDPEIVLRKEIWGGVWGRALTGKKTVYNNGAHQVPEGHVRINCSLAVPIVHHDELIGLIMVGNRPEAYGESDVDLMEKIAQYIAPVLHARLVNLRQEEARKRAEKSLRESEERYRTLFECSKDALMIIAPPSWKFVSCNSACLDMFRVKDKDEFTTMGPWNISPEYQTDGVPSEAKSLDVINEAMNEGSCYFEWTHKRMNGEEFPATVLLTKMVMNNEMVLHATVRDETVGKKREQELTRLAAIVKQANELIMVTDPEYTIQYVNPAFEQATGNKSAEIIGKDARMLSAGENGADVRNIVTEVVERGKNWSGTLPASKSDGSVFEEEVSIWPVRNASGEVECIVSIGRDVTAQRILERQLHQAKRLESIGQLAAGIAHEINTPMQYVSDNTNFLRDSFEEIISVLSAENGLVKAVREGTLTDQLVDGVERAIEKADLEYLAVEIPKAIEQSIDGIGRVTKIVRAMKEFSHPGVENKIATDINKAIESTATVSRNEWKYVSDLVMEFDETMPLVSCFPSELNQVTLNLITNAAHAIGKKLGDNSSEKGKITISTRHDDKWAEISVSDTGTGIPLEIRDRIFDPFFTTKAVGKGTGQGLSIAHAVIVEKHKGSITLDTEVGRGSIFTIRIPLIGEENQDGDTENSEKQ